MSFLIILRVSWVTLELFQWGSRVTLELVWAGYPQVASLLVWWLMLTAGWDDQSSVTVWAPIPGVLTAWCSQGSKEVRHSLQNISRTRAVVTSATFYPSKQVMGSPDWIVWRNRLYLSTVGTATLYYKRHRNEMAWFIRCHYYNNLLWREFPKGNGSLLY